MVPKPVYRMDHPWDAFSIQFPWWCCYVTSFVLYLIEDPVAKELTESDLAAKALGKRTYLPMEVTSVVAGTGEGQTDGGAKLELPSQLPFTSGVPAVGTVKGLLHLFKDR